MEHLLNQPTVGGKFNVCGMAIYLYYDFQYSGSNIFINTFIFVKVLSITI